MEISVYKSIHFNLKKTQNKTKKLKEEDCYDVIASLLN